MDTIFSVTNKSTKDMVYAVDRLAERAERPVGGVSRNIQRLTRACWDAENRKNLLPFLGRDMPIRVPKELLFHLAYYSRTGIPYIKAMKHHAAPPV